MPGGGVVAAGVRKGGGAGGTAAVEAVVGAHLGGEEHGGGDTGRCGGGRARRDKVPQIRRSAWPCVGMALEGGGGWG